MDTAKTPRILRYSYADIHTTVKSLAGRIQAAGFQTDLIVAIGSGGFIPARIMRTYIKKPILTVGIALYLDDKTTLPEPKKIQWIDEAEQQLAGKRILLVDEVDDTRTTLAYCIAELLRHQPAELAVVLLHNKRKPKRGSIPAEVKLYLAGEDIEDCWIQYPWDAQDIVTHEAAVLQDKQGPAVQ